MPKVNLGKSDFQLELEKSLRTLYGGSMCAADVGEELGTKCYPFIYSFLDGVPVLQIGARKRWRVEDIAAKIAKVRHET